jgi:hypothetical protein
MKALKFFSYNYHRCDQAFSLEFLQPRLSIKSFLLKCFGLLTFFCVVRASSIKSGQVKLIYVFEKYEHDHYKSSMTLEHVHSKHGFLD